MLLAALVVFLFLFTALGMEIAWAIGIACLGYMILAPLYGQHIPFALLPQQMLDGVDSFSLLAIPLFIFAGELMSATGVTQRLVECARAFVGHIKGGLANVAVLANFMMSGMAGSALADAAATGTVLIPQMKKRGYSSAFSGAVIASASMVAPIIPPSILFVLLGSIANLSIGRLFLAGVMPGVLMTVSLLVLTYVMSGIRNFPTEERMGWRVRARTLVRSALPLAAPLIVIRSMTAGVATPTEAACVLVIYIIVLGMFIYRTLSVHEMIHCAARAMLFTSIIMLTVATAQMFSWLSLYADFGRILTTAMFAVSDNINVLLLMFNLMLVLLGTFMEPLPLMIILAPIIFPVFQGMGVDPIQLGVIMVLNLALGLITPPVGVVLNIVAVIGRTDVMSVFRESLPYQAMLIFVLLLITYIPAISLWLPYLMMPVN